MILVTRKKKNTIFVWVIMIVAVLAAISVIFLKISNGRLGNETVWYDGPEPEVSLVTLEKNGIYYNVEALEGQATVLFNENVSHKKAVRLLRKYKAKIISQVPEIHYYQVEIKPGTESEFVELMKCETSVDFVYPIVIEYYNTAVPYVIDNFKYSNHGEMVSSMMKGCFPTMDVMTHDIGIDGVHVSTGEYDKYLYEIMINHTGVSQNSFVINKSFGPSLCGPSKCQLLYDDDAVTASMKNNYFNASVDRIVSDVKKLKHLIQGNDNVDFVITISAGNEGMKEMEKIYDSAREQLSDNELNILDRHIIFVTANDDNKTGDYPNDVSIGDYHFMQTKVDISDMTAQDLKWQGTSFSAPRAAGFIISVANEYNVTVVGVLEYAREVTKKHPQHLLTYEDLSAKVAGIDGYIDLGLPSRTLWKCKNEDGYYSFDDAVASYGGTMPEKEHLDELKSQCKWTWGKYGYLVTGPNGHSIMFPAYKMFDVNPIEMGEDRIIWSSSSSDKYGINGYCLMYDKFSRHIVEEERRNKYQVRLVKKSIKKSEVRKPSPVPNNKNFPFDYYGTIPYSESFFNQRKSGTMILSNGERVYYKYDRDLVYTISFYIDGVDIRKKYKLAALETLDAQKGLVGGNDSFDQQITLNFCFNPSNTGFRSNKLYIIVKKK